MHWREREREREAAAVRGLDDRAREAMVEWLGKFPWEWYATFTFRGTPGLGSCYRAWGSLMHELRRRGSSPRYFRGVEWQSRGVPHFHALMYDVDAAMRRMNVVDWWWKRHGMARVEEYGKDKSLGVRDYVAKYLLKDSGKVRSGDWALEVGGQKALKWG